MDELMQELSQKIDPHYMNRECYEPPSEECMWHKNISIEPINPVYKRCHEKCKGIIIGCVSYSPKRSQSQP